MKAINTLIGSCAVLFATTVISDESPVKFPENYATTYTNYLSLDRTQNPDQTIRLFANDVAMQGPGADGKLPFGSIIVAEVYKAKLDDEGKAVKSSLGPRIQDKFALVAVMQREEGWGEKNAPTIRNGNWEMGAFKPDGTVAGKDLNACLACHAPLTDTNFLFSYDHLKQ
ncbi:MAG: cytochrome P460 family protein [Granulosicoccus sp.]